MHRRRDRTILWWIGVNSERKEQQQLQKLLYELMLYILINSCGHVGTFAPFYGTSAQQRDVLTCEMKLYILNTTQNRLRFVKFILKQMIFLDLVLYDPF